MGLGLGWLRAVAQGYNYNCNSIDLVSKFQNNLRGWWITCVWSLYGLALKRKVTVTIAITLNFLNNFQHNLMSWGIKLSWGLDGCARWCKVTFTVAIKLNCGIFFKGI